MGFGDVVIKREGELIRFDDEKYAIVLEANGKGWAVVEYGVKVIAKHLTKPEAEAFLKIMR